MFLRNNWTDVGTKSKLAAVHLISSGLGYAFLEADTFFYITFYQFCGCFDDISFLNLFIVSIRLGIKRMVNGWCGSTECCNIWLAVNFSDNQFFAKIVLKLFFHLSVTVGVTTCSLSFWCWGRWWLCVFLWGRSSSGCPIKVLFIIIIIIIIIIILLEICCNPFKGVSFPLIDASPRFGLLVARFWWKGLGNCPFGPKTWAAFLLVHSISSWEVRDAFQSAFQCFSPVTSSLQTCRGDSILKVKRSDRIHSWAMLGIKFCPLSTK